MVTSTPPEIGREGRRKAGPSFGSAVLVALGLALLGCDDGRNDEDAGPADAATADGPHASLSWQVRCDTEPCPAAPPPPRSIDAHDGQAGHTVACDLTRDGDERRMDLTARLGDRYGIEIRGARIGLEGGRLIGSFCQVRLYEEADLTLLEPCQASNPSADRACQIQRVDIRDIDGIPTLSGELRCVGAQAEDNESRVRDVTAPDAASGNVEFSFQGCVGL